MREYALPLLLALALHAAVAAPLAFTWQSALDAQPTPAPRIIEAKLLVLEKPKPKPRRAERPPPQPMPPVAKPPPRPAPPQPDAAAERAAREAAERRAREIAAAEQARRDATERQQRLRELAARATDLAREEEAADLDAAADAEATRTYVDAIYQAIAAQWRRPLSARNDMRARFLIELVPSGELLGVTLLDGSGNAAFDRAAEAAIRRAGRLPVPPENALFERHFRRFTLVFNPQDLLR